MAACSKGPVGHDRGMPDSLDSTESAFAERIPRPLLDPETGIDLTLIQENLKLTPWERILANDDTINFCDAARAALINHHAATRTITVEAHRG